MRVQNSGGCLQSFAKSLTALLYLQFALALPQSLSISGSSRSQSSSDDKQSGDGSSSFSMSSQGLIKRQNCKPTCPPGTRLDSISMPACTWNCLTWSSAVIENSGELINMIATIITGALAYTAVRATTPHIGVTGKRDNVTLQAFSTAVDEIFGTKNRKRDGGNLHTVDYTTLFANGSVDGIYTELNLTGGRVAAYIGNSYAPSWVPSDSDLKKRTDILTNAKIIFHNAYVSKQVHVREFTYSERIQAGTIIAGRFSDGCRYEGRAMCDCLRSGEADEFAGALTVEGQANSNGKYQEMRCDCDARPW
ncbi:BZ3500_MvSof-1268-A1-R1_Chr12-3g04064 [Microbotryum saponariae]|uniref:BZ3500_MvSof-1268-A1-R1_Chr12-3g04064 protein n=1 Tax=Microbotryum saponariae TaxID=289078 RepID=A0A2X0NBP5_9BASI|nr:BZ3500_MvSof-1268-A1-R1_Chr12-3g04064 [Microbotryum saponariae]SDA02626.1 BZ3501_MvSof-1269-A2-R1_Chr12-3g03719 [Microbotryum saponariae]